MNDYIQRARKAMQRIHQRNDDRQFEYATVGRVVDGVAVFDVKGKPKEIYVTIRSSNGSQTSPPARNDSGVPKALGLPVRLRKEMYESGNYVYVIDGLAKRSDLAYTSPGQDAAVHTHDSRYFTETEITGAAALGTPADTDKLLTVRAGGLGTLLWSGLKTALNLLYVGLTGDQTVAGRKTFTDRIVQSSSGAGNFGYIEAEGDGERALLLATTYKNNASGSLFIGQSARGSKATPAVSQDDDRIFDLIAYGYSATLPGFVAAAQITFNIDGTPDSGGDTSDMPGRIEFRTSAEGSGSPVTWAILGSTGLFEMLGDARVAGSLLVGAGTAAAKLHVSLSDATTNVITNVQILGHNSSGTPAAGFGSGLLVRLKSSTTDSQEAGRLTWEWATATHASRASKGKLSAFSGSSEVVAITWDATGKVGMGPTTMDAKLHITVSNLAGTSIAASSVSGAGSNVAIITTDAQAADVGGMIALGGMRDNSAASPGIFGAIRGGKENGTDANTAGYLGFYTLESGVALNEKMRLTSLGYLGINNTPTAALDTPASTTTRSGLRVRHGAAPSSPNDGDMWTTTAGLFVRINGVTKTVTLT